MNITPLLKSLFRLLRLKNVITKKEEETIRSTFIPVNSPEDTAFIIDEICNGLEENKRNIDLEEMLYRFKYNQSCGNYPYEYQRTLHPEIIKDCEDLANKITLMFK